MTLNLFETNSSNRELTLKNVGLVNGLQIKFDFISEDEEKLLLKNIDNNQWLLNLKRKVQHYGYKYDYKTRSLDNLSYIGSLPDWMDFLIYRLNEHDIIDFIPDQAIVNEYISNQGISPHIDCEPCFGEPIISISLSGSCIMNFELMPNSKRKIPVFLERRSLIIMKAESRSKWYHSIPVRLTDIFNGEVYKRSRRVSVTFRKVKIL